MKRIDFRLIDFVPAISGLIGKTALVSSFAFMWSQTLKITSPGFVFDNIRIEIIIGSIITLVVALVFPNISPAGTLSPLIVMIPAMAKFGVHPFVLSVTVGIIGLISVKTKLFEKLIISSGELSKTGLTLVFGISGVLLSVEKLFEFFDGRYLLFAILLSVLAITYMISTILKIRWLIIPVAAAASLVIPLIAGMKIDLSAPMGHLSFNPFYWWNDRWGIGFGFDMVTLLKTLPFAIFVVLLWTIDTVSVKALIDTNSNTASGKEQIDINNSFIIASIRNIVGGVCGGAQTSSLWRSFLIPLFVIGRPIKTAAILLGLLGAIAGFTGVPIKLLSYPPIIWTVLLFGIFIPFLGAGVKNFIRTHNRLHKTTIILLVTIGLATSPILTWAGAISVEKILSRRGCYISGED